MYRIYADGELLHAPDSLVLVKTLLSPKLTLETGKAGALTFDMPQTHFLYDCLQKMKTSVVVESDGRELFRGRVLSEKRKFDNTKTIYCEGDLAYLVDSVQRSDAYRGTAHGLFRQIIQRHNAMVEPEKKFAIGDITVEDRPVLVSGQSEEIENAETKRFDYRQIAINATTNEWVNSHDYVESCLISYIGGYLRTRRENGITYIDYLADYGSNTTQEISFGVNLLDLTEDISADDLFTVLIPLGDENLTIASVNGGSDELVDDAAAQLYGRIVRTHVFSGVNQASTLLENGVRYLQSNVNVPVTTTIQAVDLHLLNPLIKEIHVGDVVKVKSIPHNIISALTCTKIEYNLENPSNTVYTFGIPKQTLTQRYRKDIRKVEDAVSGGVGGGGGRGGGSGAGAVADAVESKANAWCDVLKEDARVSIGASNERIDEMKHVLVTECGVDFDGNTGNINMRSLKSVQDEHGNRLSAQAARIDILQGDTEVRLDLVASRVQTLGDLEAGHYASLSLIAGQLESAIELKADNVTVVGEIDGVRTNIASINSKVTTIRSNITNIESEITNVKKLIADEIKAVKTDTTWLTSDWIRSSVGVYAPYIRADNGMSVSGKAVATQEWVQLQLDSYALKTHSHAWASITNKPGGFDPNPHTHAWSAISGKPSAFEPKSHRHSFSISKSLANNHTHTVLVDGSTKRTSGVSSNSEHSISISGNTGYTGG